MGIDLGGTKTESILFDDKDNIVHRERVPTPSQTSDDYNNIIDTVSGLIADTTNHIPKSTEYTIGIGIPGIIDRKTHLVQNANTTSMIDRPFQKDLENRIGREIGIDNDVNCFTLAESLKGAGKGHKVVFGIIIGTGCGGGICIDGRIHKGKHGIAGEWGHFSVDPNGPLCFCGNRGCIETQISGTGVSNAFYRKYKKKLTVEEIVEGYQNNDKPCMEIMNQFFEDFGRAVGGMISILDPDIVVLGGGLSNITALYDKGIKLSRQYAYHPSIETPIVKNKLGDSAGVFGAAWIGV